MATSLNHEVARIETGIGGVRAVVRWPVDGPPSPLVVMCHGFMSSGSHYSRLASFLAESGFVVVNPFFSDSFDRVAGNHPEIGLDPEDPWGWVRDPEAAGLIATVVATEPARLGRVDDVRAILDHLDDLTETLGAHDGFGGLSGRMGMVGHSLGAYTCQLMAGVTVHHEDGSGPHSYRDERVEAVVLLAGQGRGQWGVGDGSWDQLAVPMLNIAGDEDVTNATNQPPEWRREPFEHAPAGDRYQAIIRGADHGMGIGDEAGSLFRPHETSFRIVASTTALMLGARLRDDSDAARWLSTGPVDHFGSNAVEWSTK